MHKPVKPVPEGYATVTPSLALEGAVKAVEFYKKAFGATQIHDSILHPQTGKIVHAEIKIGNSIMFLSDPMPGMCAATQSNYYLYVENCDAWIEKAKKAGAKIEYPATDMFWGDRCGTVSDPWGNKWTIATHKANPAPEEMKKGQEEFLAAAAR